MTFSERIYRALLKAYPRHYRERYQEPMAQLFADQVRDANTPTQLTRLWLRTTLDLVRTVPIRYWEPRGGPFRLYNPAALRCIFFARYIAQGLEHREITPEDLLLGVLREDREVCRRLSANALEEINNTLGGTPNSFRVARNIPLSEASKRVLAAAQQERVQTGAKETLPRHLIGAILRDNSTRAAQILRRHGVGS